MSGNLYRALASSLLLFGCGTNESTAPGTDGGTNHDAVTPKDGARGGGHTGSDAKSDRSIDAPSPVDAGAARTLTTRSLLPTPVNDLLLDPFITSDTGWGHFLAVVPSVNPAETGGGCPLITRESLSASPVGVAGSAVLVSPAVLPASTGCTSILAPLSGSTGMVNAQIWVSFSDASGAPVALPAALDTYLSVSLVPTSLPSASPAASYPFALLGGPTTVAGRQWGLVGLKSPVILAEGAWFVISLSAGATSLYLAAPQVVPTGSPMAVLKGEVAQSRPTTESERGAIAQYARLSRTQHPERRRRGRQ